MNTYRIIIKELLIAEFCGINMQLITDIDYKKAKPGVRSEIVYIFSMPEFRVRRSAPDNIFGYKGRAEIECHIVAPMSSEK